MKKILFGSVLFFLCMTPVMAQQEVFYSDYGSWSGFSKEPISEDERTEVQVERRYLWYREEEKGEYFLKGKQDPSYPQLSDKKLLTEYSEWQKALPEQIGEREVEERTIYEYQDAKKVRYLFLSKVSGGEGKLQIPELEVLIDGQKINYQLTCQGCSESFYENVTNGIMNENNAYLIQDGVLMIDLQKEYHMDQIELKMTLYDTTNTQNYYWISMTREPNLEKEYARAIIVNYFVHHSIYDVPTFSYRLENMAIKNIEWEDPVRVEAPVSPTLLRKTNTYQEYRFRDTTYYYYRIDQVYDKTYQVKGSASFPLKDAKQYQDVYRKRMRDKVVLLDQIKLTKKEVNWHDYLIETTVNPISITPNINWEQNGIYQVSYEFPFQTIKRTVVLDLPVVEEKIEEKKEEEKKEQIVKKTNPSNSGFRKVMAAGVSVFFLLFLILFILMKKIRQKRSNEN